MVENVEVTSNWLQTGGLEFSKAVTTVCTSDEDVFVKPPLEDILGEDRAVLLNQPDGSDSTCEIHFQINPRLKIAAVSLICSSPKVELFLGTVKEYWETIYGQSIEDGESEENSEEIGAVPPSYRYDIEINRSGIVDVSLKMLTSAHEICIYGSMLNVAPNPNGITTLIQSSINDENVQHMLRNQKLTENAQRCKNFIETYKRCAQIPKVAAASTFTSKSDASPDNFGELKNYIDEKFDEMKFILTKRFDAFETAQTAKLNRIMELLENKV